MAWHAPDRRRSLLTVIIVNYNGWPDVVRLVTALAGSEEVESGRCEVVVVDNASQGPIPEAWSALASRPGVRLIARRDNGGFAVGVNAGWHAAESPWLLVLNPDVVVAEGLLGQIVARLECFEAEPTSAPGVVGFGLRNPDGTRQGSVGTFPNLGRALWEQLIPRSRRKYQAGWRTRAGNVSWVTGACMLLSGRMMEALGGMDEDFFLYYEEVALCRRARGQGWRVEYDPGVEVVHLHPLQNRTISPKMRVITRHSKLLYFRKHLPRWQFAGLSWIVAWEAAVRGVWSRAHGRAEDVRAWRTIGEVVRALRAGAELRGHEVRAIAEAVAASEPEARGLTSRVVLARKLRGARPSSLLEPRKDGPACR